MKKSTYRRYLRLTCTFLAFLLIVLSMPLNIIAVVEEAEQNITEITEDTTGKVVEVTERREENVKHFKKPDGTYTAVSYANEVHRKDGDGNWQDIDNSLSSTRNASAYSTKDGRVSFSKSFDAGKELFSISENGDTVAFSLMQKSLDTSTSLNADDSAKYVKVTASGITNPPLRAASWDTVEQAAEVDTSSRIMYEDIKSGVSLEYILDGNDVKENIIIKSAQNEYSYDFRMTLVGLSATVCADGSVNIYDPTNKEIKYTIPAPYMYDSNGNTSYDVSYELEQVKEGIYILRVSASKEWINADGRAFPVVIDPTIVKTDKFYDTYVNSSGTTNYGTSDNLIVSDIHTAFIKFDLPELDEGAQPNQVQLKLSYYFDSACTGQYIDLEIWRVDTFWRSGTLTSAANITLTKYEDCIKRLNGHSGTASSSTNYSEFFDITAIARDWYSGVENEGIAFKRVSDSISQVRIKSYETSKAAQRPHLYVDYSNAFSDGVYMFRNKGTYGMYMDTRDNSYKAGAYMQQTNLGSGTADAGMKFKLTRVAETDSYIIRLMTNNCLTFSVQSSFVVTKEISPYDDEVLYGDTFYITYQEDGYVIQQYASSSKIAVPGGSSSGDNGGILATLIATSTLNNNSKWEILPCSVTTHETSGFIYVEDDKEIVAGEEVRFIPVVSSTRVGYNVPEIVLDDAYYDIAEYVSSTVLGKTRYNIHKGGNFKLYLLIGNGSTILPDDIVLETFEAKLPFEAGKYGIQNRANGNYMFASATSSSLISTENLTNKEKQIWNIEHIVDNQYKIRLDAYNLYLTAPASTYGYVTMEQNTQLYAERQVWVWDSENNMFYSNIHASYAPCALSVSTGSSDTSVYHSPYSDDSQSNDEWNFIRMLPTSGYELDYDESLWDGDVEDNTNCYEYAINRQIRYNSNNVFVKRDPGNYNDENCLLTDDTRSDFLQTESLEKWQEALLSDFETFHDETGITMVCSSIGRYDQCPAGTYKIALMLDLTGEKKDYHFFRQDSDGFWSQKHGFMQIQKVDDTPNNQGDLIIDPQESYNGEYTVFIGYFAVTPWNTYYNE